jgi:hypothetical protein
MNLWSDALITSKSALLKMMGSLRSNPTVILLGPAMAIVYLGITAALAPLGIIGGIMSFLLECFLLSAFLYFIESAVRGSNVDFSDAMTAGMAYFSKVMGVLFIVFISNLLFGMLIGPILSLVPMVWFLGSMAVYLACYVLLNATPETIYSKHYSEMDTIVSSIKFVRENPVSWLLPNLIPFAIYFAASYSFLTNTLVLMAVFSLLLSPYMIFRGHLYGILSTTSMRKRYFMRDTYGK